MQPVHNTSNNNGMASMMKNIKMLKNEENSDKKEQVDLAGDRKDDSVVGNECLETDEVESEYAFDDSDEKDEVESVYAMDFKTDPTDTENSMETDDAESKYAFDGMNTTESDAIIADLTVKVQNAGAAIVALLILAFVFLCLAIGLFLWGLKLHALMFFNVMLIALYYSYSYYLDYFRLDEDLCNLMRRKIQHLKEQTALIKAQLAKINAANDEIISVYAFDALNDNETLSPEAMEDVYDVESVYAFDNEENDIESV